MERIGSGGGDRLRLLSVRSAAELARLRASDTAPPFDGVSIRHSLPDDEIASWLLAHGLLVFAWTVNDLDRLDDLLRLGVHGFMTDNLALARLLGIVSSALAPAPE